MAPAAFAAGISSSGDGVCKELAFVSMCDIRAARSEPSVILWSA
jgi:hypothetical protein